MSIGSQGCGRPVAAAVANPGVSGNAAAGVLGSLCGRPDVRAFASSVTIWAMADAETY